MFDDMDEYLAWHKAAKTVKSLKPKKSPKQRIGLSIDEKKELRSIESRIAKLEKELTALATQMEDPAICEDPQRLQKICDCMGQAQQEVDRAFDRWQELEEKKVVS
jgi:hypothetical protein